MATEQDTRNLITSELPDRNAAGSTRIKAAALRKVLNWIVDYIKSYSPTFFNAPNGDGSALFSDNQPGLGLMRFLGNKIIGASDFGMININLAGDGFSFWQQLTATKDKLLMAVRRNGVAIGTDNPEELLHVAGRIKTFGLVAIGGTPTASLLGTGLGTGGTVSMGSGATDQAGMFIITTGSNPGATQMARISFANKVARTPTAVMISGCSTSSGNHLGKLVLYAESSSALILTASDGSILPANSTLSFYYQVIV
ncbi:hypothetical protein [Spirosoma rhododendri]|uniref:Uncharacterized protein n=1 Tax=Spirosoma rhododendri TaxID=2728024 RepID=A0A7L5DM64_9BACT|nr:hypothetical protein [Spirosoma rhododendri]QJD79559.1 hypothetical protein HH216_14910 [Spirosoma rhododendri]